MSFVSLYLAATPFGLSTSLMLGGVRREFWTVSLLFRWAMRVVGDVWWMWPLAYLNHRFA